MYHQITPLGHPSFNRHLSVSVERFEEQVGYLVRKGLNFITLADLVSSPVHQSGGKRNIILSFDDIFGTFHEFALPVLQKFGIPATAFIIGNTMVGKEYANLSPAGLTPLTSGQLEELMAAGIEIGSHAMSHNELTALSEDEAYQELQQSYQLVKDLTGNDTINFCYPRGSYAPKHFAMLKEIGYKSAVVTTRGNRHDLGQPFQLKRVKVSQKHQGLKLRYLSSRFYHEMNALKQLRKNSKKDN